MSDQLKVGDLIATNAAFGAGIDLHRITKITPTLYVTNVSRFRRDDLRVVAPGRWGPFTGRIPTARDMMLVRIRKAQEAVKTLIVTDENVAAIEALLKEIAK